MPNTKKKFQAVIDFIRVQYPDRDFIALHEPCFNGNEKKYLLDCIDSTFVSSVGRYVDRFEQEIARYTGAAYAVATVNGTAALHIALILAGVAPGTEVLTQPVTFVATANAISYCGGQPVFLDIDRDTLGLSPDALKRFLESSARVKQGCCYNQITGKPIAACVPMHTFGHPCRIDEITDICRKYHLPIVEDAAESLGSLYNARHTGTFGLLGTLSFNGNKIITTGGGGAVLTNDENLARKAKHLTTTAKMPHPFAYVHDQIGFNYRMPNINAALACAQLEQLDRFVSKKRALADRYRAFFQEKGVAFVDQPHRSRSNYWLNALVWPSGAECLDFIQYANAAGVMTRPIWEPIHRLAMYRGCQRDELINAEWIGERLVNIPSSVPPDIEA